MISQNWNHLLNKSTNITADPNKFLLDVSKTELSINCPELMNKFLLFKAILKEVRTSGFLKALAIGNRAERIEVVFFFKSKQTLFYYFRDCKMTQRN